MPEAQKSSDIGMRRGRVIANMSADKQLDLIAEGLPILMKSATDLLNASTGLSGHSRASKILEGHALEEAAKILVLMDIVRCPPKIRPSRIGPMMAWFYDHLARLLYIEAQDWRPMDLNDLRAYVDQQRRSHYLEGHIGEYILPNSTTSTRETLLYADIVTYEEGDPIWSEPSYDDPVSRMFPRYPSPWKTCEALQIVGAFTREGLDIVSSAWAGVDFSGAETSRESSKLTFEMLVSLDGDKLIPEAATKEHASHLMHRWQLPMYQLDFKRLEVSLEELKKQRDANFWAEAGYDERDYY
ncbi:hypothetical protein NKI94_30200 [Mesorhizobium australicum]|uniref:hypothetical protein n=1 Tax=Mesorhizobium australicum TaxID=536018 RepID=UPI00333B10A0